MDKLNIKFAEDIVSDMEARGSIETPEGFINGEAYERWLYEGDREDKQNDTTCN